MTEIEQAYNKGLADAANVMRAVSAAMNPGHGMTPHGVELMAEEIERRLRFVEDGPGEWVWTGEVGTA